MSPSVPQMEGIYATGGIFLGWDVSLVELMYLVFTRMPGVGDSDICCCVPCLSRAFISLSLLILHKRSRPHSVSDCITYNLRFLVLSVSC